MNTKLYKQVHSYAEQLMAAAEQHDEKTFYGLYDRLKKLCDNNRGIERKDHPVQWETLADFTEDVEQALALYDHALAMAMAIESSDHIASINYSVAGLLIELGRTADALAAATQAKAAALHTSDSELQRETIKLVKQLR